MKNNYQLIQDEMAATAIKCGRNPTEITLVAVTKQVNWPTASILYDQGQRNFGENRVPDALQKQIEAPPNCRWHFIGNLQNNKVRKAIGKFSLIHSVDSLELAKKISEVSLEEGVVTPILLQANTSGEIAKNGLTSAQWKNCYSEILALKGISVEGLMTMAPLTDNENIIRDCFGNLRKLRGELKSMANGQVLLQHLSMGMSNDYKIAIEEGATLLRIGTALFT